MENYAIKNIITGIISVAEEIKYLCICVYKIYKFVHICKEITRRCGDCFILSLCYQFHTCLTIKIPSIYIIH